MPSPPAPTSRSRRTISYNLKLRDATIASRDAEQRVRATQLTGQAAGSQTDIANAGVDALTVRAPMDGQLTALDAEVGQSKAQGAVLGQVNSADRFKLTAQVDEFYLGHMSVGQESLFTVDGQGFKATIAKVYPQVINGTFKVDLHFDGSAPPDIHVGQAIDLKLELGGASQAVLVANGPFYQDTGGNWAFVVAPDGSYAERRNIRLGRRNPDYVEVVDGLKPGERIIVSGYEAFQKMDRVEFEKPEKLNSGKTHDHAQEPVESLSHQPRSKRPRCATSTWRSARRVRGGDGTVGLRQVHVPQHRGHARQSFGRRILVRRPATSPAIRKAPCRNCARTPSAWSSRASTSSTS